MRFGRAVRRIQGLVEFLFFIYKEVPLLHSLDTVAKENTIYGAYHSGY